MLRTASLCALLLSALCLSGCPGTSNTNNANNANNMNASSATTIAPGGAPAISNTNGNTTEQRPPGQFPGGGSGNQEGGRGVAGPGLPANANAVTTTTRNANTAPPFRVEPGRTNRNMR